MKAAVCREFGAPLVIEEVTLAQPRIGEVEVTLAACAICHSDIFYAEGAWGGHLPAIYGHEAAGTVTKLGPEVTDYTLGDRVIVTLLRACGSCPMCDQSHPANCEKPYDRVEQSPLRAGDGAVIAHGLAAGAFAEKVVVSTTQIHAIPADLPMDSASLLSCGVITGVGAAINSAKLRPGSTAVVVGCGGVGLNAIQGAVLCGASQVIAVDVEPDKIEGAKEFGATDGVLASDTAYKDIKALTGGRGVDYVFVTVGAVQAFAAALRYLAPHGEMVMVGMPPNGAMSEYEPGVITALSQVLRGSVMGDTVLSRDIPYLISLYQQGRLKLDELITNRYPLDQINEAIADVKAGTSRRNVIVFD